MSLATVVLLATVVSLDAGCRQPARELRGVGVQLCEREVECEVAVCGYGGREGVLRPARETVCMVKGEGWTYIPVGWCTMWFCYVRSEWYGECKVVVASVRTSVRYVMRSTVAHMDVRRPVWSVTATRILSAITYRPS